MGIVVILGAIAFANFKFKRVEGVTVNVEGIKTRDLEAIVSASGKIQPKRSVNISADTMGRVTDLAVEEGDRIEKGQFLLQIDPRNLRSRGAAQRGLDAGGTLVRRPAAARARERPGRGRSRPRTPTGASRTSGRAG